MINYKKELNEKQFEAVNVVDGPALIIAGAGTGKTKTLTFRAARLIENGINPENILLITFTNKAANEMKHRIISLLGNDGAKVTAQTFHSFCANILRQYSSKLRIADNYTIIDMDDSKELIDEIIKSSFTKNDDLPKSSVFCSMLTYLRNCEKSLDQAIQLFAESYISEKYKIQEVIRQFNEYKLEHNYLDYDDLLFFTTKLFQDFPKIAKIVATKYQYICIDEYQDSNSIQLSLIKSMVKGTHDNVMVVGDDQQSIYGFRGANFKNIINFQTDFPGAKLIILEKNYRSGQGILNLANAIILNAKEKFPKFLQATIPNNQRPKLLEFSDSDAEYQAIIQEIRHLLMYGNSYDDIAILTRTASTQGMEFGLMRNKIPYKKYGGMKLFQKAHMKDIIAYVKILANYKDEIAWKRILKMQDGIGMKTADKIIEKILEKEYDGLLEFKKRKFGERLEKIREYVNFAAYQASVEDILVSLVEQYHNTPGFYMEYLEKMYKDWEKRLEEIGEMINVSCGYTDLNTFLEDIILDGVKDPNSHAEGCLTLSTIHSAKGLEFKYVFILDCTDDNFPSYRSQTIEEIEEERRIFYTAVTRAKNELFICVPKVRRDFGQYRYCDISRFLLENNIKRDFLD